MLLTPQEILLHCNTPSKFVALKGVLACGLARKTLDGLSILKMGSLHPNAPAERFHPCAETGGLELHHPHSKISRSIERCCADIDVYHQLTMRWAHRGVKALPCFQPTAEMLWSSSGAEEVAVLTEFDTAPQWMCSKDDIQRRNNRKSVVVSVLVIPIQVTTLRKMT